MGAINTVCPEDASDGTPILRRLHLKRLGGGQIDSRAVWYRMPHGLVDMPMAEAVENKLAGDDTNSVRISP